MKINLLLGLFVFLGSGTTLQSQNCPCSGALRWCSAEGLKTTMPVFDTEMEISARVFSRKALETIEIILSKPPFPDTALSLTFDLIPLGKRYNIPSYLPWAKYFYILPLSPTPYPIGQAPYRSLAQLLLEGTENKPEIPTQRLTYQHPNFSGCVEVSFHKGLGKYAVFYELDSLPIYEERLQELNIQLEKLHNDSLALDNFAQQSRSKLEEANQALEKERATYVHLAPEEKAILEELYTLSDSVGFVLNEAFMGNDPARARYVAELTGSLEKRKTALKNDPVFKRVETVFNEDYRRSAIRFSHTRSLLQLERKQSELEHKALPLREERQKLIEKITQLKNQ